MSEWYFKKNEQKMGPFTNVEMIALYRKKEINNLTLVQKSPHPEW
ncbi:GYF domain-containing protein, partial [Listeria monocytogenes]